MSLGRHKVSFLTIRVIAAVSRCRRFKRTILPIRLRADRVRAAMRTAVAMSLRRLALEHEPACFERLKGVVQNRMLRSKLGDLLLNVSYCAFQIVHLFSQPL
jgi:hypothetical protein